MAEGWICLHRKIQECVIWEVDEKFDYRSAWIDLLLLANHEDKKIMFDGKPIIVKRGQRITSVRKLAERWHWGIERTTRFLRMLEDEKMIIKESDKRRTLLTIVNYGIYNDMPNTDRYSNGTLTDTVPEHQPDTNNNDNNENNENNNNPLNPPTRKNEPKKISNCEMMTQTLQANPDTKLDARTIEALYEWCDYKEHDKKEKYKAVGMRNLLQKAYEAERQYGVEATVRSIHSCMANNYKGIFYKPDEKKLGSTNKTAEQLGEFYDMARKWAEEGENE